LAASFPPSAIERAKEVLATLENDPSRADFKTAKRTLGDCLKECGIDPGTSRSSVAESWRKHCLAAQRRLQAAHSRALSIASQRAELGTDNQSKTIAVEICTDTLGEGDAVPLGTFGEEDVASAILFKIMMKKELNVKWSWSNRLYLTEWACPPDSPLRCGLRCSEVDLSKPIPKVPAAEICLVNRSREYIVAVVCQHQVASGQDLGDADMGVVIDLKGDLDAAVQQRVQTSSVRYKVGSVHCQKLGSWKGLPLVTGVKAFCCDVCVLVEYRDVA